MASKKRKVPVLQYNAVFQLEEDGGYSVWVPALPGCTSQGDSFEEAMENIREAMELFLEAEPDVVSFGDEAKETQFLVPVRVRYA